MLRKLVMIVCIHFKLFIDDKSTLQKYQTLRQRYAVPIMAAIEVLHRLYETDATSVVLARSIGLQLTSALTPLKVL